MEDEFYQISSELYSEFDYTSDSKPLISPKNKVSEFPFKLPQHALKDKEGDLIVSRNKSQYDESLEIEHSSSTCLNMVGLQIWRGSLLLADWLLHHAHSFTPQETILELGSGVGLTAIVASMFCPVICTDIDRGDIFPIIRANLKRNRHFTKHQVEVTELDFMADRLPERVLQVLPQVKWVIAADVVYDDHLTDAFVQTIAKLLDVPPQRTILVALEKRYVFTIRDCDTCAPCFDYFMEKLENLRKVVVEKVELDFPQYFQYDRCKELVLWKITSQQ